MELVAREIKTQAAFETFRNLIASADLPTQDLDFEKQILLGYYDNDTLMATGGLEVFGNDAILRSLTVKLGSRNKSLGSTIVDDLLAKAKDNEVATIYLLTENANGFFKKKGFVEVNREDAPDTVKTSQEFSVICGESAVCMKLVL